MAPPVAVLSWIDKYCASTTPDAFDKVNCDPAELLFIVIKLPAVPDIPKFDTVWVVPAVNVIVAGWVLLVMLLKVLLPLMVNAPAPLCTRL